MSASAASVRSWSARREKVADEIEAWFEQTDVDGLNVPFAISPGDFEDITEMLVPELTRRGRYKSAYRQGTLREKLFGQGRARLAAPHPAVRYRHGADGEVDRRVGKAKRARHLHRERSWWARRNAPLPTLQSSAELI